jgi:hypothetical protein
VPLVFVSDSFAALTEYNREDITGKNCRFLQGEDTDPRHTAAIRKALQNREPLNVAIINYTKSGTKFYNQFFMTFLYALQEPWVPAYIIGVQHFIKHDEMDAEGCVEWFDPGRPELNYAWKFKQRWDSEHPPTDRSKPVLLQVPNLAPSQPTNSPFYSPMSSNH